MNNSDINNTINASYKTCLDEVMETCNNNNIILILATIPNVPGRSMIYKNQYVKESGYRYIDFAKAVGAEELDSTWYEGMLSDDNIHPSALGAKALYSQLIADFPEILK